jgi:hypothetical protein
MTDEHRMHLLPLVSQTLAMRPLAGNSFIAPAARRAPPGILALPNQR